MMQDLSPLSTVELWTALRTHLEVEEGKRASIYIDHRGIPTIGIGHNLRSPLSEAAIYQIFSDDCAQAIGDTQGLFPSQWEGFSLGRKVALVSMRFQLGLPRLKGFQRMIAAIKVGLWDDAAKEALLSEWATQTPERAKRVAHMLKTGKLAA